MRDWTWYICVITGCIMLIIFWATLMRIWYLNACVNKVDQWYDTAIGDIFGLSADFEQSAQRSNLYFI